MRRQTVTPRDIDDPDARLKALRHDPGLHISQPAPISSRPLHDRDATAKYVPAIRYRCLPKIAQVSPLGSRAGTADDGTEAGHTLHHVASTISM
jgi:hypothetical protein